MNRTGEIGSFMRPSIRSRGRCSQPGGHRMLLHRMRRPVVCNSDLFGPILKSDLSGRNFAVSGRQFRVLPFRRPVGVARQVSILSQLKVGENAVLVALNLPESVQNHLMHMGFVPGALVTVLRRAPAGDPTVYCIDGMEIALRHETAEAIAVRPNGAPAVKDSRVLTVQSSPELEEESIPQLLEARR
jgi:ferrous iron transport protein A